MTRVQMDFALEWRGSVWDLEREITFEFLGRKFGLSGKGPLIDRWRGRGEAQGVHLLVPLTILLRSLSNRAEIFRLPRQFPLCHSFATTTLLAHSYGPSVYALDLDREAQAGAALYP